MCMTFLFRMLGVHQTNFASGVLAWCEEDLRCVTSRNHTVHRFLALISVQEK